MSLAVLSLIALLIVIVLSCTNRVHPGFLAIALAWVIGVYLRPLYGVTLSTEELMADVARGFPIRLFLTLTGVSLLFTQAQLNGTLDRIAHAAIGLCRGNVGLMPWMFFLLAAGFAMVGAGNIAAAALIAPTAMNIAGKARIPAALMAIIVGHGALAGALSPIAPTGIIAENQMGNIHLDGHGMEMFVHNLIAHAAVAALAFIIFGGAPLLVRWYTPPPPADDTPAASDRFEAKHWATIGLIGALLTAAIFGNVDVGLGAFACAVILAVAGLADDREAVRKMPWGVIVMVCGVNVLTAMLERTGGNDLFAQLVVKISTPDTAPAVLGFVAAIVSVYSSTSAVVLPVFLGMVGNVALRLPGSDPLALALAVIVAGHLVDSSPLSTIGALCIASAGPEEDRQKLFVKMLLWGLAMSVVGAIWCYVLYGLLW
jgi:di/tricarboxylate transporter